MDVVLILTLPGDTGITPTLRYLPVTNKDLVQIVSPLDDIDGLLNDKSCVYEQAQYPIRNAAR